MAEGAESVIFTQYFKDWKRKNETVGVGKAHTFNKIAKIDKVRILPNCHPSDAIFFINKTNYLVLCFFLGEI